jgi:FtsP/CotA-like multicopper oxidase with cupredoxin domain
MTDSTALDPIDTTTSRRRFLRNGGIAALAAGIGTACKPAAARSVAAVAGQKTLAQTGGTMGANDTVAGGSAVAAASATAAADAMDAMHEKGIKAFPAKTAGVGNQLLEPVMNKGVKVFEITAKKIQWETEPEHFVEAWAYNEQVPGPQIRVREGETGSELHLRVRRPEFRLAHVSLAPRFDQASQPRTAGRIHHRAEIADAD